MRFLDENGIIMQPKIPKISDCTKYSCYTNNFVSKSQHAKTTRRYHTIEKFHNIFFDK